MGFRLDQVEETEVMIAFIDSASNAHFAHFRNGFGPASQGFRQCVSKPQTVVTIDVRGGY